MPASPLDNVDTALSLAGFDPDDVLAHRQALSSHRARVAALRLADASLARASTWDWLSLRHDPKPTPAALEAARVDLFDRLSIPLAQCGFHDRGGMIADADLNLERSIDEDDEARAFASSACPTCHGSRKVVTECAECYGLGELTDRPGQ